MVRFTAPEKKIAAVLMVPLSITARQLIRGLKIGFGLESSQEVLSAENPMVLLRGQRTLGEYGIRNGTWLKWTEQVG